MYGYDLGDSWAVLKRSRFGFDLENRNFIRWNWGGKCREILKVTNLYVG